MPDRRPCSQRSRPWTATPPAGGGDRPPDPPPPLVRGPAVAAVGSTSNTARNPRRYSARACGSGSPRPSREELIQPPDAFGGRTRGPDTSGGRRRDPFRVRCPPRTRHRRRTDRMLSISRSIHSSHSTSRYRAPSADRRHRRDVVLGASPLDDLLLARLPQLEAGELAHRLVQSIAGGTRRVLLHHQRLVDQR